jgi:hypothetical protein
MVIRSIDSICLPGEYQFEGKVTSVTRSQLARRPNSIYMEGSGDPVVLTIESSERNEMIDANKASICLPILVHSDFELIPYQHALLDADVRYIRIVEDKFDVLTVNAELSVLSGALNGLKYKYDSHDIIKVSSLYPSHIRSLNEGRP